MVKDLLRNFFLNSEGIKYLIFNIVPSVYVFHVTWEKCEVCGQDLQSLVGLISPNLRSLHHRYLHLI